MKGNNFEIALIMTSSILNNIPLRLTTLNKVYAWKHELQINNACYIYTTLTNYEA
jgi:hypothetical protein